MSTNQNLENMFSTPTTKTTPNTDQTPTTSKNKCPKILQLIEQKFAKQNKTMISLIEECVKRSMGEVITQLEEKILNLSTSLEKLSERVNRLEIDKCNIDDMKKELNDAKQKISHQENINVSTNLRICGLPYADNENLHEIFEKLCLFLNIPLPYVKSIQRIKSKNNTSMDNVVMVKLLTSQERNSVLRAISVYKRQCKKQLTLNIFGANSQSAVYVNEDLSSDNYKILQAALKLKRRKFLAVSYTLHGIVYIKHSISDRPTRIDTIEQLNNLFRGHMETPNQQTTSNMVVV